MAIASSSTARAAAQRSGGAVGDVAFYSSTRSTVMPYSCPQLAVVRVVEQQRRRGGRRSARTGPPASRAPRTRPTGRAAASPSSPGTSANSRSAARCSSSSFCVARFGVVHERVARVDLDEVVHEQHLDHACRCRSGSALCGASTSAISARCHECSPLFSRREPSVIELRRSDRLQRVGLEHEPQARGEIGIERVERRGGVLGNAHPRFTSHSRCASVSAALQVAGEPAELVEHQQQAERAEHDRRADDDRGEVALHPAERAARRDRARARSTRNGRPSPIEYDGEQRRAGPHPLLRSRRCRGSNRGSARCTATNRTRTRRPRRAARPRRTGRAAGWNRFSWYSHGARRNIEPSRNSAIASMIAPEIRVSELLVVAQRLPDAPRP